jgi:C4-dicarboxylate transporter DctM subunit
MAIALILTCYIISKRRGYVGDDTKMSWALAWKEFRSAIWALLSPIIVLGGIYGGIFTPTEAAVVSVVYSLVIGVFVYRELDFVKIKRALFDTLIINGITTFMIGLSMIFATYLSLNQVPQRIAAFLLEVTDNRILLLLMINIFLLLVGCLIDNIPACIILAPILLPVVVSLGMTPLQFGIVLTMNLAIGFITPPYGPNLFVAASVANISVDKMFRQILPFILALFIVLMICTYIPATTTLLVGMMR